MIVCLNCDTKNGDGILYCRECGANLRTKKYQRSQDPVDDSDKRITRLEKNFRKLVDALEEEHAEENENPNDPKRTQDGKPSAKPKRRFPIF